MLINPNYNWINDNHVHDLVIDDQPLVPPPMFNRHQTRLHLRRNSDTGDTVNSHYNAHHHSIINTNFNSINNVKSVLDDGLFNSWSRNSVVRISIRYSILISILI